MSRIVDSMKGSVHSIVVGYHDGAEIVLFGGKTTIMDHDETGILVDGGGNRAFVPFTAIKAISLPPL
jgi:hypothetical protein